MTPTPSEILKTNEAGFANSHNLVLKRQLSIKQNAEIVHHISWLIVLLQYLPGKQRLDVIPHSLRAKNYDLSLGRIKFEFVHIHPCLNFTEALIQCVED